MAFFQDPPALGNTFDRDDALKSWLRHHVPEDVRAPVEEDLRELGELSGGELHQSFQDGRRDEPTLTHWDAWGKRVDHIELTPHWKRVSRVATEKGLVGAGYDTRHGAHARTHQFAMVYVLEPSTGIYACPLAMTDGAAKTLLTSGNKALADRAVPRLTSRDPASAWTSGQWMTERTGGSDVAICETVARESGGVYRLYGTKWFSSATTSEMALTLGRPEGGPPGGKGLALFYLEVRGDDGALNHIQVNRLKDKLGTKMVPTAELTLDGAIAHPVMGLTDGIRNIAPMLNVTRTWNAVGASSGMRRAVMLARDYASRRVAFGAPLAKKPLHVDTLAALEAEARAAFVLTFRVVQMLGLDEAGELTDSQRELSRLLTPIVKATTGKQAVAVASESLESFGGAGYVEDTGLPVLLRDAQVLPIWEGTTNVLSLDLLRALARVSTLLPLEEEMRRCLGATPTHLKRVAEVAASGVEHAVAWLAEAQTEGLPALEAGARRFLLTLGRSLELALLVHEATWGDANGDPRWAAAARRFARHGVDLIVDADMAADAFTLLS